VVGYIASMSRTLEGENVIKISFEYDLDILHKVKSIHGRKYHKKYNCWSAPVRQETINLLLSWGFKLDSKLEQYKQKIEDRSNKIILDGIPGLKRKLYPFQARAVSFIEDHKGRALIADEMGLGKTVEVLAWLQLRKDLRPVIIVVPASVKLNWKKEAKNWMTNPNVEVLTGGIPWEPSGKIIVINYDILHSWVKVLKRLQPKVLITDECHYFKTNRAKRTKAIKRLSKGMDCIIGLSGTPIENRPIEIFNIVKILAPDLFPNWFLFGKRYGNGKHSRFGWNMDGASNTEELHYKLTKSIMLRRLKKDVLKELPKKQYSFVPMELNNRKKYEFAENDFIEFVKQYKGVTAAKRVEKAKALVMIEALKQLAVNGKLPQAIHWIEDFLETDEKLVIFTTHRSTIKSLMELFGDIAVKLDGSTNSDRLRQEAVDKFQNDPKIRLFIGNMKAAGKAITLTAASNVVILELPWTPGALRQCEDRCHRIGQKKCVNIHYLLAADSIEEHIANILDKKSKVLDAVLDGKQTDKESLLTKLMKIYEK